MPSVFPLDQERQLLQFHLIGRQIVSGGRIHQAQPGLNTSQESIRLAQMFGIIIVQQARDIKCLDGIQGAWFEHIGVVLGILELQHLDDKFNVDGTTDPAFQVAIRRELLHTYSHPANFLCAGSLPTVIHDDVLDNLHRPLHRVIRAENWTRFA